MSPFGGHGPISWGRHAGLLVWKGQCVCLCVSVCVCNTLRDVMNLCVSESCPLSPSFFLGYLGLLVEGQGVRLEVVLGGWVGWGLLWGAVLWTRPLRS